MISSGRACHECTMNCQSMHNERNDPSPSWIIMRFFKIMIGKDFSKILYLPPKFARKVKDLVGQVITLEDSCGEQWAATINVINGSLAIEKGWHDFALSHELEIGQLLIFNYVKKYHFVVQVYGTSACEKLKFNTEMGKQKKKARINNDTQGEPIRTSDFKSTDKPNTSTSAVSGPAFMSRQLDVFDSGIHIGKSQALSTGMNIEDPICILDRDAEYDHEDRCYLRDLDIFEMENANLVNNEAEKSQDGNLISDHTNTVMQIKWGGDCVQMTENLGTNVMELAENSGTEEGALSERAKLENGGQNGEPGNNLVLQTENESLNEGILVTDSNSPDYLGNVTIEVKKELVDAVEEASGKESFMPMDRDQDVEIIQIESDYTSELMPSFVAQSPCSEEVKSHSHLELTTPLPSTASTRIGDKKLILLRDSNERLWPIMYHVRGNVKILAGGWKTFCEGNNIREGDRCVFQIENEPEKDHVYCVDIIRQ